MARIEVQCPDCGPVICSGADLELRQYANTMAFYMFVCPYCKQVVQRPADARAVDLLHGEGVDVVDLVVPDEVLETHDGPPFTANDLLAFHELLERPDWFHTLLR